jgi:hypothetical protein
MPAAIEFDRQLCRGTIEIEYVAAKRMLTTKFVSREISVPQIPPQGALAFGWLLSQDARAIHET